MPEKWADFHYSDQSGLLTCHSRRSCRLYCSLQTSRKQLISVGYNLTVDVAFPVCTRLSVRPALHWSDSEVEINTDTARSVHTVLLTLLLRAYLEG